MPMSRSSCGRIMSTTTSAMASPMTKTSAPMASSSAAVTGSPPRQQRHGVRTRDGLDERVHRRLDEPEDEAREEGEEGGRGGHGARDGADGERAQEDEELAHEAGQAGQAHAGQHEEAEDRRVDRGARRQAAHLGDGPVVGALVDHADAQEEGACAWKTKMPSFTKPMWLTEL